LSGRTRIVASMLVALLVAAMAIYLLMADEIGGSSADRKSYIAFVVSIVVVNLVLSIGARGEWQGREQEGRCVRLVPKHAHHGPSRRDNKLLPCRISRINR
jgi:hypothetical protein